MPDPVWQGTSGSSGKTTLLERNCLFAAELLLADRKVDEALAQFDRAEEQGYDPDACSAGRWTCHMLKGDFELAWRESDCISSRGNPDPNRFWDGTDFTGKRVIIRCLHGLGDTLQFIRYAKLISRRAAHVTVEVQPTLAAFLRECKLSDEVITWGDPEPPWDQQMEAVELPRIFRTTLDSIPAQMPYLRIANVPPNRKRESSPFRVGLVWASSIFNPARSISLSRFEPIFSMPDVQCCCLQAGDERAQLKDCRTAIVDLSGDIPDVLVTARAALSLDLIITVDTMMAHLAGGLGSPVWTLLPFASDWRWMLNRSDSPWYPTMRLFRQPKPGDWQTVIDQLVSELQFKLAGKKSVFQPQEKT